MKRYIYLLTLGALISMSACKNAPKASEDLPHEAAEAHHDNEAMLSATQFKALQMRIDTLAQRPMRGYVEANGQLEVPPQNEAAITAVIGANVVGIEVIEGDKVAKNQVLAYLSHPNIIQMQTDYLNAYTNRALLKNDFERQKTLYDAGVASGMAFQKVEASYEASKAMVQGLESQLQLLHLNTAGIQKGTIYQRVALRSPIEGYVQKVQVKIGQYVDPQTTLFEIVNTHHVHADLMVYETDVHKVKEGQTVMFSVQSQEEESLTATIYSVGKTFETEPKAIHVHAEIENKSGHLIPGMYIQGKIIIDKAMSQTLPTAAIINDGDKSYAFTAEAEGDAWSFKAVEVVLGTEDDHWVSVKFLEPLATDTQFAYNNAYYLWAELKKGDAEHSH